MEQEIEHDKDLLNKKLNQSMEKIKHILHGFTGLPKDQTTSFGSFLDLDLGTKFDEIEKDLSSIDYDITSISELYMKTQEEFQTLQSHSQQYTEVLK